MSFSCKDCAQPCILLAAAVLAGGGCYFDANQDLAANEAALYADLIQSVQIHDQTAVISPEQEAALKEVFGERLDLLFLVADAIVEGTVESVTATKEPFGSMGDVITSHVTLRIDASLKAAKHSPDTLVIRTVGGTLDGETTGMSGAPSFEIGERVLLPLELLENGEYRVIFGDEGKIELSEN